MRNGGRVEVESGVPDSTVEALEKLGHTVRRSRGGFGGYQAVARDLANDTWIGASESRKDGHAAGY